MASDPGPKPQKEINKLKAQVKHLQKEKDKSFPDLGRATYQAFLDGRLTDPALVEAGNRIRAMDNEIEQASAEVARLQALIQQMKASPVVIGSCPACSAPVTPGLRFCGSCGAPLAQQAPMAAPGFACPNCGAAQAPGSRFCGECGTSFQAVAPPPAPMAPPPPPPAAAPPPPPAPVAPTDAPGAPPPSAPAEDKGSDGEQSSAASCPSCGAAIEEAGAAFCGECGAKL